METLKLTRKEAQLNGLKNFEIRNWWRQTNEISQD